MKILIACEYSGRVRDAFTKKGHYAMSGDILPTESEGPHYQGDVLDVLNRQKIEYFCEYIFSIKIV